MVSHSPVVSFSEGIDVVAQRIFTYAGSVPYVVTIRGISGVGKSHFGREIVGKLYFQKHGTLTKPHDLERELEQKGKLEYVLLEIDEIDNGYGLIIERKTKDLFRKVPDYHIMVVYDLGKMLDEKLTLARILEFFDLIVENKEHPDYR